MNGTRLEVMVVERERHSRLLLAPGENLLMALVSASYPVSFSCTTGKCTTCRLIVTRPDGSLTVAGETEAYRLGPEVLRQGVRLACQVFVHEPLVVKITEGNGG